MPQLKRLLVATDLSGAGKRAVERAARLALTSGARLSLIHVATPALLEKYRRLAPQGALESGQALLDRVGMALRQQAAEIHARHGVASDLRVVAGGVIDELAGYADATAADLIVLGFCGASLTRHFLLGSTAERLLPRATCPLLVVKEDGANDYRSLLVPVDFSAVSVRTLAMARSIVADGDISLLHVYTAPFEGKLHYAGLRQQAIKPYRVAARQEALRNLQSLCAKAGLPAHRARLLAINGHPAQRIVAQQKLRQCDLIVIGKQGENLLENLLLGSVTRQVLTRSSCDLLICS